MYRKRHHLPPSAFVGVSTSVSLTLCTHDQAAIFREPGPAGAVVSALERLHDDSRRVLVYCIMPDHVHILCRLHDTRPGRFVAAVKGFTTRQMRRRGVQGEIWQRDYHDRIVRQQTELVETILYVILNPVRRGLVESWQEWPWSGSFEWTDMNIPGLLGHRQTRQARHGDHYTTQ